MEINNPIETDIAGRKKRFKRVFLVVGIVAIAGILGFLFWKASNVLTIAGGAEDDVGKYDEFSVEEEQDRIDVLILGIRGSGDPHGGLLADTILLTSFHKEKKRASMVSIPRDLYIKIPDHPKKEKVNFAYALGEQRKRNGGGMALSREVVQYITGVYIDHVIVVNFEGFTRTVDILGGTTVHRNTPFFESQQWQGEGDPDSPYWYKETRQVSDESSEPANATSSAENGTSTKTQDDTIEEAPKKTEEYWVFRVPAGTHTLDGEETLYYVRSRYTSSDFDRARRQQQVITALKEKALSLGVLSNPVKVFNILDALGDNVRTTMGLGDIRNMISLIQENRNVAIETYTIEASEEGLLRSTFINENYVLLPKSSSFDEIRDHVRTLFHEQE